MASVATPRKGVISTKIADQSIDIEVIYETVDQFHNTIRVKDQNEALLVCYAHKGMKTRIDKPADGNGLLVVVYKKPEVFENPGQSDLDDVCPHCKSTNTVSVSEPMFPLSGGEHDIESLSLCHGCEKHFVIFYDKTSCAEIDKSTRFS